MEPAGRHEERGKGRRQRASERVVSLAPRLFGERENSKDAMPDEIKLLREGRDELGRLKRHVLMDRPVEAITF